VFSARYELRPEKELLKEMAFFVRYELRVKKQLSIGNW
jgi:hypothetical protein